MSVTMLRFELSELKVVRVTCSLCGRRVVEVSVDQLNSVLDHGDCRLCKKPQLSPGKPNPLDTLCQAIQDTLRLSPGLTVEFELPHPGP
jgi:hypothetical protein